jgi:hypothetical protein
MSSNCPACQNDKYLGFNYCRLCGNELRKDRLKIQKQDTRRDLDRFCGNCGKPVDECKC